MASRLIIEFDERTVRVARASWDQRRVHLAKTFWFDFEDGDDLRTQTQKLKAELHKHGLGRGETDVIFNRRSVELREITLPPAPDDELPDLLKYSARTEFASVNDNWAIDFVPLTDDPAQPRQVLAGAVSPQLLSEAKALCDGAGLRLTRVLLRPFCVASTIGRDAQKATLLVHDLGATIDLTVVSQGRVWLTRTVLLVESGPTRWEALAREIQRALMLAQRATGRAPHEILIIANTGEANSLKKLLDDKGVTSVRVWNANVEIASQGGSLQSDAPEQFLAHYGAAKCVTEHALATLDFANPRRRAERRTDYKRIAIWGGLAAILLISLFGFGWMTLSQQSSQISQLESQFLALKKANDGAGVDQIVGEVGLIDKWVRDNINWIDELKQVSERLLTADDAMVSHLKGDLGRQGPELSIRGRLTSRDTNTTLKSNLSKRPYEIDERRMTHTDADEYPYEFDYLLALDRSGVDVPAEIAQRIREAESSGNQSPEKKPAADNPEEPAKSASDDSDQPDASK